MKKLLLAAIIAMILLFGGRLILLAQEQVDIITNGKIVLNAKWGEKGAEPEQA